MSSKGRRLSRLFIRTLIGWFAWMALVSAADAALGLSPVFYGDPTPKRWLALFGSLAIVVGTLGRTSWPNWPRLK